MKSLILPFLAASILIASCSGKSNKTSGDKETPPLTKTTSSKTERHVQVPGSELWIIAPPGFTEDKTTMQLRKEYANIMRMQIFGNYTPEKFFAELKTQADKDSPGSWNEEKITLDGHAASIYTYKTSATVQLYLSFTDGKVSDMLIATYEPADEATGKQMYEALKTVIVQ